MTSGRNIGKDPLHVSQGAIIARNVGAEESAGKAQRSCSLRYAGWRPGKFVGVDAGSWLLLRRRSPHPDRLPGRTNRLVPLPIMAQTEPVEIVVKHARVVLRSSGTASRLCQPLTGFVVDLLPRLAPGRRGVVGSTDEGTDGHSVKQCCG